MNLAHALADNPIAGMAPMKRAERIFIGSLFAFLALAVTQPMADLYRACFFLGILPASIYLMVARRWWEALTADHLFGLAVALLSYLFVSTFWSDGFSGALAAQYSRWFVETLVFAAAAYLYASTRQFERLPHGLCLLWLVLAASAVSLAVYFIQQEFPQRLRGVGMLKHEILGSGVLITLWALALMDPKVRGRQHRPLVLAALLGVFVFVYLTQSRGPLLSLAALCAVLALFAVPNRKQALVLAAVLALAGYACVRFGWSLPLLDQMMDRGDSYRLDIWRSVVQTLPDHWLFGQGVATEFANSEAGAMARRATGLEIEHPHNLWLSTLFYGGVLGAALLLGLVAGLLSRLRRLERESAGFALGVIAVVIALCMTDTHRLLSSPREIWVIFWLPLMMVAGATARA